MPSEVVVDEDISGEPAGLEAVADRVLAMCGLEASQWCIRLTGDVQMRQLNATWRGKSSTTDELSFPQDGPVAGGLLGDVVISLDTAQRQADELAHDLKTELCVLMVHGLCHLMGHDHHVPSDTERMQREERRLLSGLAVPESCSLVARSTVVR